jgi:tetratricopeptide (TPR) repeat protein
LAEEDTGDVGDPIRPDGEVSRPVDPGEIRCKLTLSRLRALDAAVPVVFLDLTRSVDEINEDIKEGIALSRRFLAECNEPEPSSEVKALLARFLLARNARHREEIEKERYQALKDLGLSQAETAEAWETEKAAVASEMDAYFREIKLLVNDAVTSKQVPRARQAALRVALELAEREGNYENLRESARVLLEEHPDYAYASSVRTSVARSYASEGRYKEAVDYLRGIIEKRRNDPECVIYNDRLFDALTGMGDLEGMEDLMHQIRNEYPDRMQAVQSEFLKGLYEQWYYNAPFWIGFVRMALGDAEGAKAAFRESIVEIEQLRQELTAQGKSLNKVIEIYLEFRTKDLLEFLEDYQGNAPKMDFDLGSMWATDEKLTLQGSRGSVVAALFRPPRNVRAQRFLQEIDRMVKERKADGLRGITLGFLTGQPKPAAREGGSVLVEPPDAPALEALRDDLRSLDVSLPAGYDPDRQQHALFKALHAMVGTPTFVVFDKEGRFAWYLADPRDLDRAIARRVLERLLAL